MKLQVKPLSAPQGSGLQPVNRDPRFQGSGLRGLRISFKGFSFFLMLFR